jgi:hypothetical protein
VLFLTKEVSQAIGMLMLYFKQLLFMWQFMPAVRSPRDLRLKFTRASSQGHRGFATRALCARSWPTQAQTGGLACNDVFAIFVCAKAS